MNSNISPVDWYIGSYLVRFVETESNKNYEDEERFVSWENTVIVRAKSLDEAYSKIEKIGKDHEEPYKGGEEGIPVQWIYEGITQLLPIYEDLEDGAEIMYTEHNPRKLKNLKKWVGVVDDFAQ